MSTFDAEQLRKVIRETSSSNQLARRKQHRAILMAIIGIVTVAGVAIFIWVFIRKNSSSDVTGLAMVKTQSDAELPADSKDSVGQDQIGSDETTQHNTDPGHEASELAPIELKTSKLQGLEPKDPELMVPESEVPASTTLELKVLESEVPEKKPLWLKVLESKAPESTVPEQSSLELKVPEPKATELRAPAMTTPASQPADIPVTLGASEPRKQVPPKVKAPLRPAVRKTLPTPTSDAAFVPTFHILLSSLPSEEAAISERNRLSGLIPEPLVKLSISIEKVDLGERGTTYRLTTSDMPTREVADDYCAGVNQKDGDCLVIEHPAP